MDWVASVDVDVDVDVEEEEVDCVWYLLRLHWLSHADPIVPRL